MYTSFSWQHTPVVLYLLLINRTETVLLYIVIHLNYKDVDFVDLVSNLDSPGAWTEHEHEQAYGAQAPRTHPVFEVTVNVSHWVVKQITMKEIQNGHKDNSLNL